MRYALLLFSILLICSCAAKTGDVVSESSVREAYVILPGNFITDIAAQSKVTLNPMVQEFIIFSDQDEARKRGLLMSEATGQDWRVYLLEGNFDDLARKCGKNYCLAYPARVLDWLGD